MPCITKKYNKFSDCITGRRNLSGIYFVRKQERGGIKMAEIKIKSFGELRDIVIVVLCQDLAQNKMRSSDN